MSRPKVRRKLLEVVGGAQYAAEVWQMHAILQCGTIAFGPLYYGVPEEVLRRQECCTEGDILSTIVRFLE